MPTTAHHAIARLAANGHIKVIITTNFDRLIESALGEAGLTPQVISTKDQAQGATPIIHAACTVIKLHGDYQDTRILNTPDELQEYPEEYNRLLDRIFDEFGLIVCGWSAEWDTALRDAIYRAKSRRYTTFWAAHGEIRSEAKKLIAHRRAQEIPIEEADSFFQSLADCVESIRDSARSHPLSIEIAVTTAKRFLLDEQADIQLHDLINGLADDITRGTNDQSFSLIAKFDKAELNARMRRYGSLCEKLVGVAAVAGYWSEQRHSSLWTSVLQRLMSVKWSNGYSVWIELSLYPATLLLYSLGIGAVAHKKLHLLSELLALTVEGDRAQCTADLLAPSQWSEVMQRLEGMSERRFPLHDWLCEYLRRPLRPVLASDAAYQTAFDELEILLALSFATRAETVLIDNGMIDHPPGLYLYRSQKINDLHPVVRKMKKSIDEHGGASVYVESGIFGKTADKCRDRLEVFSKYTLYMQMAARFALR